MSEKVTIPADVADLIGNMRKVGCTNEEIARVAMGNTSIPLYHEVLSQIPFDTLLAALVNGYEREQSPEEYVRDLYRGLKEEAEFARTTLGTDYGMSADRARRVMECTLNALGIKIEGVNA